MKIFDELEKRGLVKQTTNTEKIRHLLNEDKITFYIGFDPTADSLHVGHLLQLVTVKRLLQAGHRAALVIGGATALIGDPSGKSSMRKMLSRSDIRVNSGEIIGQMERILRKEWIDNVSVFNNLEWFDGVNFLEMLREVGPHFSVNVMLRADCFKSRMESGLSFLEFNYMVMQGFDFFHLHQNEKCALQIGGDDQWSNMLAGIDLIHKKTGEEAFALTLPLLLNSDGTKMGKTEKGAVWLSEEGPTSIFDFFQFWRNLPDTEVIKCFKMLTFFSLEEIESLPFSTVAEINSAKKKLAHAITEIVHGKVAADATLEVVEALFESRDSSAIEATQIDDGIQLLELLVTNGFAKSRTDARNLINGKGIAINDQIVETPNLVITHAQFGNELTIRKGKKSFGRFVIKEPNA